jgi:predicted acylesterase/phospholipase RssA
VADPTARSTDKPDQRFSLSRVLRKPLKNVGVTLAVISIIWVSGYLFIIGVTRLYPRFLLKLSILVYDWFLPYLPSAFKKPLLAGISLFILIWLVNKISLGLMNKLDDLAEAIGAFHRWIGWWFAVLIYLSIGWLFVAGSYNYVRDAALLCTCSFAALLLSADGREWLFHRKLDGDNPIAGFDRWFSCAFILVTFWLASSTWDHFRFIPPPRLSRSFKAQPLAVGLTLSGGGYRAALFHAGVLNGLESINIFPTHITSVSGGSLIAAYYALGGTPSEFRHIMSRQEIRLKKTLTDFPTALHLALPLGIPGTNIELLWFSRYYRTDVQRELVERAFLSTAQLQDLPRPNGPQLLIVSTDLSSGAIWGFGHPRSIEHPLPVPETLHSFLGSLNPLLEQEPLDQDQELYFPPVPPLAFSYESDTGHFPSKDSLAELVTASGAFPFAFNSVSQQIVDPSRHVAQELALADGGMRDNSGVIMMQDAERSLHWKMDYVISSDASQIIEPLASNDPEPGILRALDVIYAANGAESHFWERSPNLSFYEDTTNSAANPFRLSPQPNEGGGIKLTLWQAQRALNRKTWFLPRTLMNELLRQLHLPTSMYDLCREKHDAIASTCEWSDQSAKTRLANILAHDLNDCLQTFARASTLKDDFTPKEVDQLFRLGEYLVLLHGSTLTSQLQKINNEKKIIKQLKDILGITVAPLGAHWYVTDVTPGSAAERAGVTFYDDLWTINGKRPQLLTLSDFQAKPQQWHLQYLCTNTDVHCLHSIALVPNGGQ